MKTLYSIISFGTVSVLLGIAGGCLAVAIWQSGVFPVLSFTLAALGSVVSVVLSVTKGWRSLADFFSAIYTDVSAYLRWSELMNSYVRRWIYWRLVHPIVWRLVHCWNVILLRRHLIFMVAALIVGLVTLVTFLICPTFAATAHILVRDDLVRDGW
jgi:hypothetical protein